MTDRFETFVMTVTRAYKSIQQIKKHESVTLGIKGIHVMCLYFLGQHPEGLTVTELSALCCEDKAATSRTLDFLEEKGYTAYETPEKKRRWRAKITLTEAGQKEVNVMDRIIFDVVKNINKDLTMTELDCFYKVFFTINGKLNEYCQVLEHKNEM